ncbi:hypothetical protein FXO38_06779 [Capsicum annuum]|uniref:NB-ARC domain-containing protein n=1 Tax=Capsicum annuum TaxID=4072 RepID=A0A2G2ZMF4_CAPAN|nr:hypothetical protein FXO37_12791 [Capsicum annuum]KAF3671054.1 hypothetical protein FXO38_06779 [Capsicum annuum]PHT83169.1 hypothetical protein T459_11612 [Capsicum annuum]
MRFVINSLGLVSQGFSGKILQDDIPKIVHLDLSDAVGGRQTKMGNHIKSGILFKKKNNIFIILDEVWDPLCLEKLLDVEEGCRLILTLRSKSLGCETLFSLDIEPISKSMAGRCKGLPFGLITLAGSMRGVTDIRDWKNALKEFPDDMENDVFKVLQYSYDWLKALNICKSASCTVVLCILRK